MNGQAMTWDTVPFPHIVFVARVTQFLSFAYICLYIKNNEQKHGAECGNVYEIYPFSPKVI